MKVLVCRDELARTHFSVRVVWLWFVEADVLVRAVRSTLVIGSKKNLDEGTVGGRCIGRSDCLQ